VRARHCFSNRLDHPVQLIRRGA